MTSVLAKIVEKAFIHVTKINSLDTKLYRLQAFRFLFLCGESKWESKENTFYTLG